MHLRKGFVALAVLACGTSARAQSIVQAPEVLTNPAVVTLAAAGFNEDFLIELILRSRTQFDTSVDGLASLAKQGVTERIIRVMLNAPSGRAALATSDTKPVAPAAEQEAPTTPAPTPHPAMTSRFWGLIKTIGARAALRGRRTLTPDLGIPGASVIQVESADLPRAIQGLAYSAGIRTSVDGRCPAGNVGLFLASGSLPPGLRTTDDGLAGVPKETGVFRFSIGARNNCSSTTRALQLLVTGPPVMRAVPERIEFTVSADSPPDGQPILISSTWPGLPYSLSTPDGSWLTLRQAQGTTPESGSALRGDRATVTAIPLKLAPGVYHGKVIVSAWRADPLPIEVTVNVTMPKPTPVPPPWLTVSSTLLQLPPQ